MHIIVAILRAVLWYLCVGMSYAFAIDKLDHAWFTWFCEELCDGNGLRYVDIKDAVKFTFYIGTTVIWPLMVLFRASLIFFDIAKRFRKDRKGV